MSKLTSRERAMTEGTSWAKPYDAPPDNIQIFKDGAFVPLPDQDQQQPAQRSGCTCLTCQSGRARVYSIYEPFIDQLITILVHGSEQEQQELYKVLHMEQEGPS